MQKLDRPGWAAGISFEAYGLLLGIRVSDSSLVARLQELIPPGSELSATEEVEHLYSLRLGSSGEGRRVRRYHLVYSDSQRVGRTMDLEAALEILRAHLHLLVAEMARDRVFVHAGAVSWRGRAILVPGRSFSGKSTLIKALLDAGAGYLSDEFAVLDERGWVHPFARPLSLRRPGTAERQEKIAPDQLGANVESGALPVGGVLVTEFQAGSSWSPRRLSPGETVLGLLAHTVAARRSPIRVLNALEAVALNAASFTSPRPEASETAPRLLELFAS